MNPVVQKVASGFDRALKHAETAGIPKQNVEPHTLKSYQLLSDKVNTYSFNIREDMQSLLKDNESRLLPGDAMIVDSIGFGIQEVITKADAAGALTYYPGNSRVFFYPDVNVFSGAAPAGAVATESQALLSLFTGGKLKIQVDKEVVVDGFDMANFLYVPETQATATTTPNYGGIVTRSVGKPFKFAGDKTNVFNVTISGADLAAIQAAKPAASAVGTQNFFVMFLQGYILRDGAKSVRVYA